MSGDGPRRLRSSLPAAKSARSPDERSKLKRTVAGRGLTGLANDTKWDEFIAGMRVGGDWRPSYRFKCIDGPVSAWAGEWFYHLPFPLVLVEWLDVSLLGSEQGHGAALSAADDSAVWIEDTVKQAGLDYRRGRQMLRIFGYAPRNLALFDE